MNCANHQDKEAAKMCRLCGKPICAACLVELAGRHYCSECLTERVDPSTSTKEEIRSGNIVKGVEGDKKSRFLAFILSTIPGVGYFYLGLMNRGLQTMLLFFGSIFVSTFIGLEEFMALIAPVVVFYSIFDTQHLVKEYNRGVGIEDRQVLDIGKIQITQSWIGYVLVVIGVMALMHNLSFYIPFWGYFRRMFPGILIIAAGVYILYRNTPKNNGGSSGQ